MAYGQYGYQPNGYQIGYYAQPMPDQLAQLRQGQYQPQQAVQAPPQPQGNQNSAIIWVGSEWEANNYPVAPNAAVALWDSSAPVIYLKQADASGKPTMKVYDLVERSGKSQEPHKLPGEEYVTRTEFDALAARLDALATEKRPAPKAAKVKEAEE